MKEQDILDFKASIRDFTDEELKQKQAELQDEISKMILDSDAVMKIAIIDALIKERKEING